MAVQYWLVKSEPFKYSWDQFVKEKRSVWDGVRSFEARNNLRKMKKGDLALFYHSNEGKEVVGVAKVVKEAYPDPTATEGDWSVVDFVPVKPLKQSVGLAEIKADPAFEDFKLVRRARLSVVPASAAHFRRILKLGQTKI
jgi:predicted RNA-binding protein with PUA-like domain